MTIHENISPEFGFSFAGGHDIDGNSYTDIMIGSPGNDAAIVLR